MKKLLVETKEFALAESVDGLQVYDRCRCGVKDCATVYTQPRPAGKFGPNYRSVVFWDRDRLDLDTLLTVGQTSSGPFAPKLTVLDIVDEKIACIEVVDDHENGMRLYHALPDTEEQTGNVEVQ